MRRQSAKVKESFERAPGPDLLRIVDEYDKSRDRYDDALRSEQRRFAGELGNEDLIAEAQRFAHLVGRSVRWSTWSYDVDTKWSAVVKLQDNVSDKSIFVLVEIDLDESTRATKSSGRLVPEEVIRRALNAGASSETLVTDVRRWFRAQDVALQTEPNDVL